MSYNRLKNKASLHRKQGFFTIKTRLVCDAKKPCLKSRENEYEKTSLFTHHPSECVYPFYAVIIGHGIVVKRKDKLGILVTNLLQ